MKLLILGGNGMAGHMLVHYFRSAGQHTVFYTSRDASDEGALLLDVTDLKQVDSLMAAVRPHIVINATGMLNEACERSPIEAYQVNGLLPQRLRQRADVLGAKVIHISTDCVFAGTKGQYEEADIPDGTSVYAVTKALGEMRQSSSHLTIRTSIIGPEIRMNGIGLLGWFLRQFGPIQGYRQVRWNGITTLQLAKMIDQWMLESVSGLVHLAHPEPLSKFELLRLMQAVFHKEDVSIHAQDEPVLDRTLLHTRTDIHYILPDYMTMLCEMAEGMKAG